MGHAEDTDLDRWQALHASNIVITGAPSSNFSLIQPGELKLSTVCMNFTAIKNFAADVEDQVETFIPRGGLVTIAMCMRNTLRLYNAYQ